MTQPIATTDTQKQPVMQDWQARLVEEAKDLRINLEKISAFIRSIEGEDHPHESALIKQRAAMHMYLSTLKWRLRIENISWSLVDPSYVELSER